MLTDLIETTEQENVSLDVSSVTVQTRWILGKTDFSDWTYCWFLIEILSILKSWLWRPIFGLDLLLIWQKILSILGFLTGNPVNSRIFDRKSCQFPRVDFVLKELILFSFGSYQEHSDVFWTGFSLSCVLTDLIETTEQENVSLGVSGMTFRTRGF